MSERANPVVVGGFVVGALVLLVAGVLLFGSGALLRERIPVVAFFSGNVRGLQEGSEVEFRGVRVGTVTSIQLALDVESNDLLIPVYMELETGALTVAGAVGDSGTDKALPFLDQLVAKGLRARLDLKSFVTGQLTVGLDMHPGTEAARIGAIADVYELPTVRSALDEVTDVLQDLPLQDIATKLVDTLDRLAHILDDDYLAATLRDTAAAAADTRKLMAELGRAAGPLLEEVRITLAETRSALGQMTRSANGILDEYGSLAARANARIGPLADRLEQTLKAIADIRVSLDAQVAPVADAAVATLGAARSALAGVDDVLAPDSRTRYNLDTTLEELASAARSLRIMADYLAQHPDALIRGKDL